MNRKDPNKIETEDRDEMFAQRIQWDLALPYNPTVQARMKENVEQIQNKSVKKSLLLQIKEKFFGAVEDAQNQV